MFAQLEKKYGRNYSSQEERDRRYEIFKENYEAIDALKREDPTLPIGMTNAFTLLLLFFFAVSMRLPR